MRQPRYSKRRGAALSAALALGFAACADEEASPAEEEIPSTTVTQEGSSDPPPGAVEFIDDPAGELGGMVGFNEITASGGDLWFRDVRDGDLALYQDGNWWRYPDVEPARFVYGWFAWGVAALADGSVLATGRSGVSQLVDDGWEPHPALGDVVAATDVVVDDDGVVWVGTAQGQLHRWDGSDRTLTGSSSRTLPFEELAITSDGEVWGTSRAASSVSSHDPATDVSRSEAVPIEVPDHPVWNPVLTVDPDGDLWTMAGSTSPDGSFWRLVELDVAAEEWTVVDVPSPVDDFGVVFPWSLAADGDDAVWVAFEPGNGFVGDRSDIFGVYRFDGAVWTTHLEDRAVSSVAVAGDGTVWAATEQGPIQVTGASTGSS